jgi:hypothetical protein
MYSRAPALCGEATSVTATGVAPASLTRGTSTSTEAIIAPASLSSVTVALGVGAVGAVASPPCA